MKYLFIATLVALAILVGVAVYRTQGNTQEVEGFQIALKNLPPLSCPQTGWLTVSRVENNSPIVDKSVPVESCQFINISSVTGNNSGEYDLQLKLPMSLATEARITLPLTYNLDIPISLGDGNNDNIIDAVDQSIVTESLFKNNPSVDFNSDGRISIEDYLLTKTNQGVGVERIDGRNWQEFR